MTSSLIRVAAIRALVACGIGVSPRPASPKPPRFRPAESGPHPTEHKHSREITRRLRQEARRQEKQSCAK